MFRVFKEINEEIISTNKDKIMKCKWIFLKNEIIKLKTTVVK